MTTYIVWNKEATCCDTYEELLRLERDGYSHSSSVSTDDIAGIINAVLDETNADFGYHLVTALTAAPLKDISGYTCGQLDVNACIVDGKVYEAIPSIEVIDNDGECTGCVFLLPTNGMTQHCCKLKCSPEYRADKRDVIWAEKVHHYTGHKV